MFKEIMENVKNQNPVIDNITNYVTVNDCANILLACGASPIMCDNPDEIEDIMNIASGLNINIGTISEMTVEAMFVGGKKSNDLGKPVVLDPVGAGASKLRTSLCNDLLDEVKISVIRGNASEIKTLAKGGGSTRGVDSSVEDTITEENLEDAVKFVKEFSKKTGAIIVITGAIDIVSNSERAFCIRNGHKMMSSITGTGCQLSALITAFASANKEKMLEAVATAVILMGVCGELSYKRLDETHGNSTYRNYIIDDIYNATYKTVEENAKYTII